MSVKVNDDKDFEQDKIIEAQWWHDIIRVSYSVDRKDTHG